MKRENSTKDLGALLQQIGITNIDEINGMSINEFREKFSGGIVENMCLDLLIENNYVYIPEGERLVNELPIPLRIRFALLRSNIYLLSELRKYPREEILELRGIGVKSLAELEKACADEGVKIISLLDMHDNMTKV